MRLALVYDCLYPLTVGGAERWLRRLALELAVEHDVTYVTRRQWSAGEDPLPGVRCVAVSPGGELYRVDGSRLLGPPLRFGLGVFEHFARHRRDYDAVHCLSYPYAPLVALRAALAGSGTRIVCEWLECLSDDYWRSYGALEGRAGRTLERLCVRLTPEAVVFSRLSAARLRERGLRAEPLLLGGLADEPPPREQPPDGPPVVVFAGRHVEDKGVLELPPALALVRESRADVTAVIAGDGPQRAELEALVDQLGLGASVETPGFVTADALELLYRRAACLVAPSRRDGFGMVVAEAAARGVPVVTCAEPDNAAAERVVEGENGALAASRAPHELAAAILRVLEGGTELREHTAAWYDANADSLSLERSLERARALYSEGGAPHTRDRV